jgi:hypothetical protein
VTCNLFPEDNKMTRKATARTWAAALAVGGAIVFGAPAAIATTAAQPASQARATQALPAPTMVSAVLLCGGQAISLDWTSSVSGGDIGFQVFADGRPMGATSLTSEEIPSVDAAGLTGNETFTVVATDFHGTTSPPSNGLRPTQQDC